MRKVLILGGGLGGAAAAKALADAPASVTVIDKAPTQSFQPLLPQVASGAVAPEAALVDLRDALPENADFREAEVAQVDAAHKEVQLKDGTRVAYDYLIVATGASATGPAHTLSLKSVADAERLQGRFVDAFARADREADPAARRRLLTFVVVGGGPTGVETAGGLGELARELLTKYPHVRPEDLDLRLVHGGDRLLPELSKKAGAYAEKTLRELSVRVQLKSRLDSVAPDHAVIAGERVATAFVVFAAGVKGTARDFGLASSDARGRLPVAADLSLASDPSVFVIGDAAAAASKGRDVPSVAPAAIQGGAHAGEMVKRDLVGKARAPFEYVDKGSAVQITRKQGVVEAMGMTLTGTVASASIMGLHAMYAPDKSLGARASLFSAMAGFAPRTGLQEVPNDFSATTTGALAPAGSLVARAKQGALTATLAAAATAPHLSGLVPRTLLRGLSPMPPIAGEPEQVHRYRSHIPSAEPEAVFSRFVAELPKLFAAAGLTVHAGKDGRMMLEDPAPPPLWMPIEAKIDRAARTITITTLDGHPLRGTNAFSFESDGAAGTVVSQETRCQASSELSGIGARLFGSERQAAAWREFHAYLYRLFA
jgi:NADH dehydrogenase FAD-containing subunit